MRIALGVDNENARPVSSASVRTVRPSTSESVKSMPPLTIQPAFRDDIPLPAHVPLPDADWIAMSHNILDCLQSLSTESNGVGSFGVTAHAEMLQEIAVMRDTLLGSLRIHVRETIEELHDARRAFQHAYTLYRDVRKASDRVLGGSAAVAQPSQESDHVRRRTTDSGDSELTVVSENSYVLVNRKARSMSDLRSSQQAQANKIPVPTIPRLLPTSPRRSTTVKYHPDTSSHASNSVPSERGPRRGSCTIPTGTPKETPRKRSTTVGEANMTRLPTSPSRVSLTNSTAKVKAWLINKIRPGAPRAEAIPEDGRLLGPSQADHDDGSSSESDDSDCESDRIRRVAACQKGLSAAQRDLHRIEGRLEAVSLALYLASLSVLYLTRGPHFTQAEQFLVNANRAISKAELRINRAIAVRVPRCSW